MNLNGFWDTHVHIIPHVDDGAKNFDMAMEMIDEEVNHGVENIVLTPHIYPHLFEKRDDVINEYFCRIKKAALQRYPNLKILLGYEIHVTTEMDKYFKDFKYTIEDSKYVLCEFSHRDSFLFIKEQLSKVFYYGYTPIVAHAERCYCLASNIDYIEEIVNMGCLIQLSASSIYGDNGRKIKKVCKRIISRNLVDMICSDAHDITRRTVNIKKCFKYIKKKFGKNVAQELMINRPSRIFDMNNV